MSGIHTRILVVGVACVAAFIAGAWTARLLNAPLEPSTPRVAGERAPDEEKPTLEAEEQTPTPLFFAVRLGEDSDRAAVEQQVQFAAAAGIGRYMVIIPWTDEPDWEGVLEDLSWIAQRLPQDHELWLQLGLSQGNVPTQQAPAAEEGAEPPASLAPSVGDPVWRQDVLADLTALFDRMEALSAPPQIAGYVLSALENGWWTVSHRTAHPENETAGFRAWLAEQYGDDAALQAAWDVSDATLAEATPPEFEGKAETFFLDATKERPQMDFLRYISEATGAAITAIAGHVRSRAGEDARILATYGYSFALANPDSGHFALGTTLEALDGIVAPVALVRRGLGEPGGFAAPSETIVLRGKEGIILDATRTGLGLGGGNASDAEIIFNDVLNVQRRNFALASVHGWRVAWADEQGQGNLNNPRLWAAYESMTEAWRAVQPQGSAAAETQLLVVVDEASFFVQRPNAYPEDAWLAAVRDVALRAGLSARFVLLSDLLEGRVAPAPLTLFANVYRLGETERAHLHDLLAAHNAAALWRYAPGYFDADRGVSAENVTETTGIIVKPMGKDGRSNSVYAVSGNWIQSGNVFGVNRAVTPLFYIDDPDADVLATYADTERASAAIRFLDGWTSVLVCEPVLPVDLLREVADILELPLFATRRSAAYADLLHGHGGKLVVHSAEAGERTWDLGALYDVVDLLDPEMGWRTKRVLTVQLALGETLLLALEPAQAAAPIAEPPPLVEEDLPAAEEQ